MLRLRRPALALGFVALLSVVTLLAVDSPAAQASFGVNRFAAIAYSPQTGRYGFTSGATCLPDAEARAIANCGACDARIVVWAENGWAAFARSPNGSAVGYGVSTRSLAEAEAIALRGCALNGFPGSIIAWAASG
jgi:hypothetical protein